MSLKFNATKEQIQQMAANAVNASVPVGLGFLHHDGSKVFKLEEFDFDLKWGLHLDYIGGRMVKLDFNPVKGEENKWEPGCGCESPRSDYQSWCWKYPTLNDLFESVGITGPKKSSKDE